MSSRVDNRAAVEVTAQWERAVAAAWHAIQQAHPELAELDLATARQETVPCADTDTAPAGAAVRTAIEQAREIEDLDYPTATRLVGQVALTALLHLAAHALAGQRGRKETSNRGYYHNQEFVRLAEEVGLDAFDDGHRGGRGWHHTNLGAGAARYGDDGGAIDVLTAAVPGDPTAPTDLAGTRATTSAGGSRGYVAATCQCTPPRRIRASRTELERGGLDCRFCGVEFTVATSTT